MAKLKQNLRSLSEYFQALLALLLQTKSDRGFCDKAEEMQKKVWRYQRKHQAHPDEKEFETKIRETQRLSWFTIEDFETNYKQLRKCMKSAYSAKTEMVEANLRLVISIAKRVPEPGAFFPRFDSGGQHGIDESRGKIRIPQGLQIFHLRYMVDQAGDYSFYRGPGRDHSYPCAHD